MAKLPLDDIIKAVIKQLKGKPQSISGVTKVNVKPEIKYSAQGSDVKTIKINPNKGYGTVSFPKGSPEYKAKMAQTKGPRGRTVEKNKVRNRDRAAEYQMALRAEKKLKASNFVEDDDAFKNMEEARQFLKNYYKKGKR